MPETWTLTPIASNEKELEALMYGLGGSTCRIRPHERRAGLRGVFDLLIEERTNRERQEIVERMERVGLRRITEEEQRIISAEILLPGLQIPPLLPHSDPATPPTAP